MYSTLPKLRVVFVLLSILIGLGYLTFIAFGDYLFVLYLLAGIQLAAIGNEIGMLFLGRRQAASYLIIVFSVLVLGLTVYILIMTRLLLVGDPVKY